MRWIAAMWVLAACGGEEPSDGSPPTDGTDGACDEPVYYDAVVTGTVTDGGAPAEGVEIRIEERNWAPGTVHGSASSAADGSFAVDASGMPIIGGCWGWATGFYVVAQRGTSTAEWGINSLVVNAWLDDETEVELVGIPLDIGD